MGRLADLRARQATVQEDMSRIDQDTAHMVAQNMNLEVEIEELRRHTPSGPSRTQDLLNQEDRINAKKDTIKTNGKLP